MNCPICGSPMIEKELFFECNEEHCKHTVDKDCLSCPEYGDCRYPDFCVYFGKAWRDQNNESRKEL